MRDLRLPILALILAGCGPTSQQSTLFDAAVADLAQCTVEGCKASGEVCDPASHECVGCLTDGDCTSGKLCSQKSCVPGCSNTHGCPDGGGLCDPQSKQCKACSSDKDCGGQTPRCDGNSGLCVPCLPANDNCPEGDYCTQMNGMWHCATGCKDDADCPGSDGGATKPLCCNHLCTDGYVDNASCGTCGNACGQGNTCCEGSCADVTKDLANCGGCGRACTGAHAMLQCSNSTCGIVSCTQGFADCNKNPADGCEVSITGDSKNCGACGMVCNIPNVAESCVNGQCQSTPCLPGFADCDGNPQNGCETNTNGDPNNCGGCGTVCNIPNAQAACVVGACLIAQCNFGFGNCDGNAQNGCETSVANDPQNCGACSQPCVSGPNAMAICAMAKCTLTCNQGFADCNNNPGDGCEAQLAVDKNNCGQCGKACGLTANVTSTTCSASACAITGCAAGYADCNGVYADGCEAHLTVDNNNCGQCGKPCINGQMCVNSACSSGCLQNGKSPPAGCFAGTDVETLAKWVVCTADCNQAWLSDNQPGGGSYHALQICNSLGYSMVGNWSGNYGTICGTNQGAGTCAAPGTSMFATPFSQPDCGSDQFGGIICNTVEWQCLK